MKPASTASPTSGLPSSDALQAYWQQLNTQYFSGSLPPIAILWSRRLTSSVGMFSSRGGPRAAFTHRNCRQIRLSLLLFEQLTHRTPSIKQELRNTLAHEMIHQWQFDILKRRPDHGLAFLRKMKQINGSGDVAVTTYHSLEKEVIALSRFSWQCLDCGRLYRRQRKTIQPQRHHCGACRGTLQELTSEPARHTDDGRPSTGQASKSRARPRPPQNPTSSPKQLTLELA
ncbi:MAG: SprT-like domain-containing protein [Nitrospira sp.]|nr:SprT-like domain-containing protein [Nitrospira sp.]